VTGNRNEGVQYLFEEEAFSKNWRGKRVPKATTTSSGQKNLCTQILRGGRGTDIMEMEGRTIWMEEGPEE
jgi:hypothetical protein